jgi:biotin-independent malonate decarboxylase gamma subunit
MNAVGDRARVWMECLAGHEAQAVLGTPSVLSAEVPLGDTQALALGVVRDPESRLPRAANGELGLQQAWALAARVRQLVAESEGCAERRPILAIVDAPGQAFGRVEEQRGLSVACAAAIDAYAAARKAGHPVLALIVGRALSGAYLAHGTQSDRVLALAGDDVLMHVMSRQSIARITRRTTAEIAELTASVLPMSYAIRDAWRLGLVDRLIEGVNAAEPSAADAEMVRYELTVTLTAVRNGAARAGLDRNSTRSATVAVQRLMRSQWGEAMAALTAGNL